MPRFGQRFLGTPITVDITRDILIFFVAPVQEYPLSHKEVIMQISNKRSLVPTVLIALFFLSSSSVNGAAVNGATWTDKDKAAASRYEWNNDPNMPNFLVFRNIAKSMTTTVITSGNEPPMSDEDFVFYSINVVPHITSDDTDNQDDVGYKVWTTADPPVVTRSAVRKLIRQMSTIGHKAKAQTLNTREALACPKGKPRPQGEEIYAVYDLAADADDAAWLEAYTSIMAQVDDSTRQPLLDWMQRLKMGMSARKYDYRKLYEGTGGDIQENLDQLCTSFSNLRREEK